MTDIDSDLDHTLYSAAKAHALTEISRADGKANTLVSAYALPLAVLVAVIPGHSMPPAAAALVGLGSVGLITAMLILLLFVIMPRISGRPRGSYLYWATCTPEQIVEDLQTDTRADEIHRLSGVALKKHAAVRIAVIISATALAALATAPIVAFQ
ncbi:DUF5706 domain-containing protein (plasmid) [Streptomyces decoyicus]|uniref:Pycsar system effector family protein n=1 Tax=Streptomyces decoyicus TaxID=249567 RepID=UPI002E37E21D|nr:Pycsar system effector family protein [Streptomyces decoyicus]